MDKIHQTKAEFEQISRLISLCSKVHLLKCFLLNFIDERQFIKAAHQANFLQKLRTDFI
jgi:hypothetical protein